MMSPWLFLLVAVAAVEAQMDGLDYAANYWNGPQQGCINESGAGQMILTCTLPSGNMTLQVDRSATHLKIACQENSTLVCEELQEARQFIEKYIVADGPEKQLNFLIVDTCRLLQESLDCPLSLVGASGSSLIRLERVEGELEKVHFNGIKGLTKFRMYDVDTDTTAVPYTALSTLPNLKSFSMKGGSLILKPHQNLLPNLVSLELAEGRLKSLPRSAFTNTPNIQTLLLWNNEIEYIDRDAFEGLTKLVNLSLNANLINHLPNGLFRYSPQLGRVDLYKNRLEVLQEALFSGLQRLKEVIIFDNNATLNLADRAFSNLPSLHKLKLDTSSIGNVPADLFLNTTNLKTLSLKGNDIKYISSGTFSKIKLVSLNLSNNSLTSLSGDIFEGQEELIELELQLNSLEMLPGGVFSKLKSLKFLNLAQNSIDKLERSVFNGLFNLKELSLDGNRIQHLHHEIFEFTLKLEVLSLANNNLRIARDENTWALFPVAGYASLTGYSQDSPFRHLAELRRLELAHNRVAVIGDDWRRMLRLERLDLAHNDFTSLTDVDMSFSTNVTVDFRYNKIQYFEPDYVIGSDIPTFLMDHNPYSCDCALYNLVNKYRIGKRMPIIRMDRAECAQPKALRGFKVTKLKAEALTCNVDCNAGFISENKTSNSTCDTCVIRPDKLRLEMSCREIPDVFPQLPLGISSIYVKVSQATDVLELPQQVTTVDLSCLNITRPPRARSIELNLTNNALTTAPEELLENNCTVYLRNNPFDCTCEGLDSITALHRYVDQILDFKYLTCSNEIPVANMIIEQMCTTRNATVTGLTLAAFGILLAVVTAVAYRYLTEIRILLRKIGLWHGKEVDDEFIFDVFISFAHPDEEFVRNSVVPNLETGKTALKTCIHYRDWIIGDWIPAQIERSVEQSRFTLLVLSKHFVRSTWSQIEFRAAHAKGRVIILLMDDLLDNKSLDPELRSYILTNTYVRADDPLVWGRLTDALLRRRGPAALRGESGVAPRTAAGALDVRLQDGQLVNKNKPEI